MAFKKGQGGRKPGALNKRTQEALEAAGDGLMPLDYMLSVLRDPSAPMERKDWAAEKAAPYLHARLSSIESKNETTVRYVARVPDKAANSVTWQQQHAPALVKH